MQSRTHRHYWSLPLVGVLLGCAGSRQFEEPSSETLFVHVDRGRCVGLVLRDADVVRGFMAYDGGPVVGMAWPITVQERLGDNRYRVECSIGLPGKRLSVDWVLQLGAQDDWTLEYSLRREHAGDDEQHGGLAVSPERVRVMLAN